MRAAPLLGVVDQLVPGVAEVVESGRDPGVAGFADAALDPVEHGHPGVEAGLLRVLAPRPYVEEGVGEPGDGTDPDAVAGAGVGDHMAGCAGAPSASASARRRT